MRMDQPQSVRFRSALPGDANAIFAIYRSWIGSPYCTWSDEYPTRDLVDTDLADNALYCLDDGRNILAVATVRYWAEHDTVAPWHSRNPIDLMRIAVARNHQNRGLARLLLEHLTNLTRSTGHDGMRILVAKKNLPAVRLYQNAGAIRRGEVFLYGTDWFCDEIVYTD